VSRRSAAPVVAALEDGADAAPTGPSRRAWHAAGGDQIDEDAGAAATTSTVGTYTGGARRRLWVKREVGEWRARTARRR